MISDARLAAQLAEGSGRLLLEIRAVGGSESGVGRRGDVESNRFLIDQLAEHRPGDCVLSEESADDPARLKAERVWIIDPLDGTREFGLPGRDDWAVHVALWEAGQPAGRQITAAAVAQPATGHLHASDDGPTPAAGSAEAPRPRPLILVSDSRPPAFAPDVARAVGADVAPLGSAGAKAMAVVRGEAEAYLHAGGQWEWDSAAPVGVASARGLHCSRIDGSPLLYNQPRPYLPDLLICRTDLAGPLLEAMRALGVVEAADRH